MGRASMNTGKVKVLAFSYRFRRTIIDTISLNRRKESA